MTPGEEKRLREEIADQITAWKFDERPPQWMGRDEVWQLACDDCAQIALGEQAVTYEPAFDDYTGAPRSHAVFQPWGHGPVGMVGARGAAHCWQCGWDGPDRTGDPHAAALLIDDVTEHAHQVGANCGMCAACQGEA